MDLGWVVVVLIIIGLVVYANSQIWNDINSNVRNTLNKINISTPVNEEYHIKKCKENFYEFMRKAKIKSIIDFSYSIIEIKEFNSNEEANKYSEEFTSGGGFFFYTYPSGVGSKICKTENSSKVVLILHEIRPNRQDFDGMKFTEPFYCDENGDTLERCIW